MAGSRLPRGGTRIDRSRSLRFTFDGASVEGFAGDTVASALLASGRTLVARSFKYHRPRGIYSAGSEEPNALVTLGEGAATEANAKATIVEAAEGLAVTSQNAWPSLATDFGAVNSLFGAFFGAGFYYKTFIGPFRGAWMLYEPFIRRAAGLGKVSLEPDPDRYETAHAFCDVLVVGGGPAGLSAARAAGRAGARVILCDDNPALGGGLDLEEESFGGDPAEWLAAATAALGALPHVRIFTRTSVYGYYDDNVLGAVEQIPSSSCAGEGLTRQRHWRIQAKRVVLAAGALERPFVFPGNDLPGVMLAGAALAYARRYAVAVGREVVVFTNNDSGWRRAASLSQSGVPVRAVIDCRRETPRSLAGHLAETGTEFIAGHAVTAARGGRTLKSVVVEVFDQSSARVSGAAREIACDALLVSAGFSPLVHLASQAGGPPVYDEGIAAFLPGEAREAWEAAGAMAGTFRADAAAAAGAQAGAAAAGHLGFRDYAHEAPAVTPPEATGDRSDNLYPLFEIPAKGKAFVDMQNDVTASDVRLARQEGFESVEHLKRYTTLGMAADQGKTSNLNGLSILARERGVPIPAVGATRFRPPYNPVSIGALVGRARSGHLQPLRRAPLHDWHVKAGAEMINAGLWERPRVYARPGETLEQAYVREARAVRASVGITDVSTLGKIDVQGPDAAIFLDRVYTNTFSTLPVGRARYGLMLRDDGFMFDDGTTWRLSESRYLMTTTTANAALVMQHLEMLLAIAWPELRVSIASVSDHFAGAAVAGPNSRALLDRAFDDMTAGNAAFPMMGVRAGRLAGVPVLVARLSFSGERAYEVYCGADHAVIVWERLLEAGAPFDVTPYGLEALGTLRIEKGHVTGAEIDGRTTVHDLGLEKMFSMKKDFVGKPLALRPALTDPGRKQLVGIRSLNGRPILAGAHLVSSSDPNQPGRSEGNVTAMCYSPALECYIALALLERGTARHGETVYAADPLRGTHGPVLVTDACFFDKDGSRMHG